MYLYSQWSDKGYLELSKQNRVADLYELLGIYQDYCQNTPNDSFLDYYNTKVEKAPLHFRNIGERAIKETLKAEGKRVSRKEIRFLSKTWRKVPVIASSKMDWILHCLLTTLVNNPKIKTVLDAILEEHNVEYLLDFEATFLYTYVGTPNLIKSARKLREFDRVVNAWQDDMELLHLE